MSLAGARSNRGDAYQTQVALDWAISMLADAAIQSVEVDATVLSAAGPVPVDDVVVRSVHGSAVYCQCKKNEPDFGDWSVATLSDELEKAARLLLAESSAEVRFYSRSAFGQLAKLREYAVSQADAAAYVHGLTQELSKVDAALMVTFQELAPPITFTYDFLRRTTFELTPEFDTMEARQLERLRQLVSSATLAFEALWFALDRAGASLGDTPGKSASERHRLSREELLRRVSEAGSFVTPPRKESELEQILKSLSAVGQAWRRDIAGTRLSRVTSADLLNALTGGVRSVLLTAGPGAGKSCLLLDLVDGLAVSPGLIAVYVQCRVFAEAGTVAEREGLGFPAEFAAIVARMAEFRRVVVVFDSLDVLSLSRENQALNFFLAQVDQVLALSNTAVVAACRSFDAKYDGRLATRKWELKLELPELDWEGEVVPLLHAAGIQEASIADVTRRLICNPRHLALFHDIAARGRISTAKTHQELTKAFLDIAVREESGLGDEALGALERLAEEMLRRKSLEVGRDRANLPRSIENGLLSAGVLQLTDRGNFEFTHQTLLDVLAIGGWERSGGNLLTFIDAMPHVPFVRPAVRAYVLYVGVANPRELRNQLRAVAGSEIPHHLRRLVCETFAEIEPTDEDWPFVNWLRQHTSLFEAFFARASSLAWHRFLLRHLAPIAFTDRDGSRLVALSYRAGSLLSEDIDGILPFWMRVLDAEWLDRSRVAMSIGFALGDYKGGSHPGIEPLLAKLLAFPLPDHDSLGGAVLRAVQNGSAGDDLLWKYMTRDVDEAAVLGFDLDDKLRCVPHVFGEGKVLATRMKQSERLLDLSVAGLELWGEILERRYRPDADWVEGFLRQTSYEDVHSRQEIQHVSSLYVLIRGIESAVLEQARSNSRWWQANRARLASSREGAMRYWVVRGLTERPSLDLGLVTELACQQEMLTYSLAHEVGEMIGSAMPLLSTEQQNAILGAIDVVPVPADDSGYQVARKCELIKAIPACFRSPGLQELLDTNEARMGSVFRQPRIRSSSGTVRPPFEFARFLDADDDGIVRLLHHYGNHSVWDREWGDLIGGGEEVGSQLREAASRAPLRLLSLLAARWSAVPDLFKERLLDGCRQYAEHRFGSLQYNKEEWVPKEEVDRSVLARFLLDELERHPAFWDRKRETAQVLSAVSRMIDPPDADRVAFQLCRFLGAGEPYHMRGLIDTGINSGRGNAAEAAVQCAIHCIAADAVLPPMLLSVLRMFCADPHPAVRAIVLHHLPYFISRRQQLGWTLFDLCMSEATVELWKIAEPCLYWGYYAQFPVVAGHLEQMLTVALERDTQPEAEEREERDPRGLGAWARISALSSLAGHIDLDDLLSSLGQMDDGPAWRAAAGVWSANANSAQHRPACFTGLTSALSSALAAPFAASVMRHLFEHKNPPVPVPEELIALMFRALASNSTPGNHYHPHEFSKWLDAVAGARPDAALSAFEGMASYLGSTGKMLYDSGDITCALTRLFREAEERETQDDGRTLHRLIKLQDRLLAAGVHGLDEWLRAAERP